MRSRRRPRACTARQLDVTDSAAVDHLVEHIVAEHGRLDVVVNAAGTDTREDMDAIAPRIDAQLREAATGRIVTALDATVEMTDEQWRRALSSHLDGTFYCIRAALRPMRVQRSGAIVNVASMWGIAGATGQPHYSAAKGGVLAPTRSVAKEVIVQGIRVNAVAPGWVETDRLAGLSAEACGRRPRRRRSVDSLQPRRSPRWCCSSHLTRRATSSVPPSARTVVSSRSEGSRWRSAQRVDERALRRVVPGAHGARVSGVISTDVDVRATAVGVVSTWNEAAPCNMSLRRQAQAVKKGVRAAGATPYELTTITVTDGIAMGTPGMRSSLVSREAIADSVELAARMHRLHALVGIAGCDKTLPGLMMAMCRLNIPSVFLYGGTTLPGVHRGRDITPLEVVEGLGRFSTGAITEEELAELEAASEPSAGSCGVQATANTMACVSEALGLALPGSAGPPAVYDARDRFARESGVAAVKLVESVVRPRDILTRAALENATAVVAATGGSSNATLHLPAIAHECGIEFTLADMDAVFRADAVHRRSAARRPVHLAGLLPGGGVPVIIRLLLDAGLFHGECTNVAGRTMAESYGDVAFVTDQDVIAPLDQPFEPARRAQGPARQPRARGCGDQGGAPRACAAPRSRAHLRVRGGLHAGGPRPCVRGRRRARRPQRGATRGPGHA